MNRLETTDFLFTKIKKLYPNFIRPDELDIDVWADVLNGFSQTEILNALKAYRATEQYDKAPTPGLFKQYLSEEGKNQASSQSKALKAYHDLKQFPCPRLTPEQNEMALLRTIYRVYGVCLNGFKPEGNAADEMSTCPELSIWALRGRKEAPGLIRDAFGKMARAFLERYPELERTSVHLLCQNMRGSGWWDIRIEEFM